MSDQTSIQHSKNRQQGLLIFGEVLYDCFEDGTEVLGGAPFNVAWSLRGFGLSPTLVSSIGNDAAGLGIKNAMHNWGLDTSGLQTHAELATGRVSIEIKNDEPSYSICQPRAWDAIAFPQNLELSKVQLMYHGSLALRSEKSRESFEQMINQIKPKRFFDVNLRAPHYTVDAVLSLVEGVEWLKLNTDELSLLLGRKVAFDNCRSSVEELRTAYRVKNVILTGEKNGAIILGEYGEAAVKPAPIPEPMVDSVGAGDAFAATTICGVLQRRSAAEIVATASRFASKVCTTSGATVHDRDFYAINFKTTC